MKKGVEMSRKTPSVRFSASPIRHQFSTDALNLTAMGRDSSRPFLTNHVVHVFLWCYQKTGIPTEQKNKKRALHDEAHALIFTNNYLFVRTDSMFYLGLNIE